MAVSLHIQSAGKRYDKHWIFREVSLDIQTNQRLAVLGGNGSGKSTFLKMLSGYLKPSQGIVQLIVDGTPIPSDQVFAQVAMAAPYIQLLEDLTLMDMIGQHMQFMPLQNGLTAKDVVAKCLLEGNENKALKFFSSGMKQRLKLGLAMFSQRPILLLDEPTSNLDNEGVKWYQEQLAHFAQNKLLVVGSNEPQRDIPSPDITIAITDYKKKRN